MEILTSKPRSFKMDRRSPQASELKASVTQKLLDFLGDYSDDVLANLISSSGEGQSMASTENFFGSAELVSAACARARKGRKGGGLLGRLGAEFGRRGGTR
ncbi:hypothetical protein QJS10_CPB18g00028 [Acorus calamus]|uniref:Uncharacterized protein n=1 Tax=Acorus calamus TaxID=4465 RepID=A0AAV9CQJ5_ACOCL|nr:hypothetical protein QJS10_CPB18g00028 [Acorus calamus]